MQDRIFLKRLCGLRCSYSQFVLLFTVIHKSSASSTLSVAVHSKSMDAPWRREEKAPIRTVLAYATSAARFVDDTVIGNSAGGVSYRSQHHLSTSNMSNKSQSAGGGAPMHKSVL
ncbi:hypothetical protein QBC46DRAFT_36574 [Diplogelasinospora grovesii]|uniref:Uncharacterized protein n=1 Tax=Diplogelasinospora grovesii TaxID=303347 RepID=A0AAN6N0K1_9PEZI|nr:hypothetical protein QBC46DRAFT_36574 [Diplogelasinospora grovesii]